jgi:integrase
VTARGAVILPVQRPAPIVEAASPHRRIAADLQSAITSGVLRPGELLPAIRDLSERYKVSHGTAQRAVAILAAEELVVVSRGRRATVAARAADPASGH